MRKIVARLCREPRPRWSGVYNRKDHHMIKFALAAGLAFGAALMSQSVYAAPLAAPSKAAAGALEGSFVELVQGGRCRSWRRECSLRWGFRTARYHRCMARRGC
jgi:hypothetical protein